MKSFIRCMMIVSYVSVVRNLLALAGVWPIPIGSVHLTLEVLAAVVTVCWAWAILKDGG